MQGFKDPRLGFSSAMLLSVAVSVRSQQLMAWKLRLFCDRRTDIQYRTTQVASIALLWFQSSILFTLCPLFCESPAVCFSYLIFKRYIIFIFNDMYVWMCVCARTREYRCWIESCLPEPCPLRVHACAKSPSWTCGPGNVGACQLNKS